MLLLQEKIPPKTKASKKKADSDATTKQKPPIVPKKKKGKKTGKGKQKAKELDTIFEVILTKAEQLKIITKRSRKETHSSYASGSGADEGTGVEFYSPDIQRQLYKALVDVYEADKILLDTYGDTVTLKRPRDGVDDDQEPSAGTDQGSPKE
ncbi:hypothetical protein Tco_1293586 [Tanacetum coccineum]